MDKAKTVTTSAFDLTLTESSETLRLGTDALLLSAYIKPSKSSSALEIGAGNGSVSMLVAKRGCFKKIYALEIQPELCEIMNANVTINGFEETIAPVNADIRKINPEVYKGVSVIFSNPPYMKEGAGKSSPTSSKQIARHEVHGGVAEFCAMASKILKTGGRLYLVYRPDRLESLMHALYSNGFSPKRMTFVHADSEHSPSSVLTEAVLGGGEALYVTKPLFLKENGFDTEDCKYIYGNGTFPDSFFVK